MQKIRVTSLLTLFLVGAFFAVTLAQEPPGNIVQVYKSPG